MGFPEMLDIAGTPPVGLRFASFNPISKTELLFYQNHDIIIISINKPR
jgi:hypothetical protein